MSGRWRVLLAVAILTASGGLLWWCGLQSSIRTGPAGSVGTLGSNEAVEPRLGEKPGAARVASPERGRDRERSVPGPRVRLLVVDEMGAPAPRARVWYMTDGPFFVKRLQERRDQLRLVEGQADRVLEIVGVHVVTDPSGHCDLAMDGQQSRYLSVVAAKGEAFGERVFDRKIDEDTLSYRVRLRARSELVIRVTTANRGVGAGLPIAYCWNSAGDTRPRWDHPWEFRTRLGNLDVTGRLRLRGSQRYSRILSRFAGTSRAHIVVDLPGCDAPNLARLIDFEHPPREVVSIEVPPLAELEVRFRDATGQPIAVSGSLDLDSVDVGHGKRRRWAMAVRESETAVFPGVAAGRDYGVRLLSGGGLSETRWTVPPMRIKQSGGSGRAGRTVREFSLSMYRVLHMSLAGEDGQAIRGGEVTVRLNQDGRREQRWTGTPNAAGAVRVVMPMDIAKPGVLYVASLSKSLHGIVRFPKGVGPSHHLGTVTLRRFAVVAFGSALDPSGKTIERAAFAWRKRPQYGKDCLLVQTKGKFEVRSKDGRIPAELGVVAPGFVAETRPLKPGENDFTLRRRPGLQHVAIVLVSDSIDLRSLTAILRYQSGRGGFLSVQPQSRSEVGARGGHELKLTWREVDGGSYELWILGTCPPCLLTKRMIEVSATSERTFLDLRGKLTQSKLEIVTPTGAPVSGDVLVAAKAAALQSKSLQGWVTHACGTGLFPGDRADWIVATRTHRTRSVALVRGQSTCRIVLRCKQSIVFEFAGSSSSSLRGLFVRSRNPTMFGKRTLLVWARPGPAVTTTQTSLGAWVGQGSRIHDGQVVLALPGPYDVLRRREGRRAVVLREDLVLDAAKSRRITLRPR